MKCEICMTFQTFHSCNGCCKNLTPHGPRLFQALWGYMCMCLCVCVFVFWYLTYRNLSDKKKEKKKELSSTGLVCYRVKLSGVYKGLAALILTWSRWRWWEKWCILWSEGLELSVFYTVFYTGIVSDLVWFIFSHRTEILGCHSVLTTSDTWSGSISRGGKTSDNFTAINIWWTFSSFSLPVFFFL